MTVFDVAAAVLHADRNLSLAAEYRSLGRGPATSMRVILSAPSDQVSPFGHGVRVRQARSITVLAADCTPAQNDTWTLVDAAPGVPAGTVLTALDVEGSTEGTSWTVTCR